MVTGSLIGKGLSSQSVKSPIRYAASFGGINMTNRSRISIMNERPPSDSRVLSGLTNASPSLRQAYNSKEHHHIMHQQRLLERDLYPLASCHQQFSIEQEGCEYRVSFT